MRELHVLTVIAINTFRYVGKYHSRKREKYIKHVEADIDRLINWGVDCLQIDSEYFCFIDS